MAKETSVTGVTLFTSDEVSKWCSLPAFCTSVRLNCNMMLIFVCRAQRANFNWCTITWTRWSRRTACGRSLAPRTRWPRRPRLTTTWSTTLARLVGLLCSSRHTQKCTHIGRRTQTFITRLPDVHVLLSRSRGQTKDVRRSSLFWFHLTLLFIAHCFVFLYEWCVLRIVNRINKHVFKNEITRNLFSFWCFIFEHTLPNTPISRFSDNDQNKYWENFEHIPTSPANNNTG